MPNSHQIDLMAKIAKSPILQIFEGDFLSVIEKSHPGHSATLFPSNFSPECLPDSSADFSPFYLDTLVQLAKSAKTAQIGDLKNLQKRGRSKENTRHIVAEMLTLGSELHNQYSRAYNCAQELVQEGDKVTTKYCNSRICHTCNRIRTAKLTKGYVGQFLKMSKPEFITLTAPNVPAEELNAFTNTMLKEWAKILDVFKKKKIAPNGIRKLETTHNIIRNDYHPHLHGLADQGLGDAFVNEWLKRFPKADIKAQSVQQADKGSLDELFKYTTKIGTGKIGMKEIDISPYALDTIMLSMVGRRSLQPFGNIRKVSEDVENLESVKYKNLPLSGFDKDGNAIRHIYRWEGHDWFHSETGTALTNRKPGAFKINFLYN